ncbi:amidase [Streptomyces sp. NBC_00882]|uniref:amidase n=1 Tax=Streptomyces TaxID=1883 RepID=UPI00386BE109|nr:amidase [Streptomyces sp. NBC_00882]WSZ56252.1 amidase [Streptomyces canus]
MADVDEIARLSAVTLIEWYQRERLSPMEVVNCLLDRAEHHRGLNALLATDPEQSRAEARQALKRHRNGTARPLEGVPIVIKDLIDTAGLETTYGSSIFAGHLPAEDATVVARIRAAGGIVIGKATTHEFAWGITTDGTQAGPTCNPWDPSLVPGGSSGGSAAALAVGLAPLALGTDTAGSIRIPAAFCGVTGLRPTFAAVPTKGVFPLAPSLDCVGPLARNVEDLELLLSVIAPDAAARKPESEVTVGLWERSYQAPRTPETAHVFDRAIAALKDAGVRIVSVDSGALPPLYATMATIIGAEAAAGHRRAGLWPAGRAAYHPGVRHRMEQATAIPFADYAQAQHDRMLVTSLAAHVLGQVDVLLTPVSGAPPAPIGHDAVPNAPEAVEFREQVMAFTALQSLTGVPACVVRAGFDGNGLPVGLQLTAAWGGDRTVLRTARLLSDVLAEEQHRWPDGA